MDVANGVLTEKHYNDLSHLAHASLYGMNALLSWNMSHLVKMRTQDLANATNIAHGYYPIQIRTPEEVTQIETD